MLTVEEKIKAMGVFLERADATTEVPAEVAGLLGLVGHLWCAVQVSMEIIQEQQQKIEWLKTNAMVKENK